MNQGDFIISTKTEKKKDTEKNEVEGLKFSFFPTPEEGETLEHMLVRAKAAGMDAVELSVGGSLGNPYCIDIYGMSINDGLGRKKRREFLEIFQKVGIGISAFVVKNNLLHPDPEISVGAEEALNAAMHTLSMLRQEAGPTVFINNLVVAYSGCPEGTAGDSCPNWALKNAGRSFGEIRKWQLENRMLPFWKNIAKYAEALRVRIALELESGNFSYSLESYFELRNLLGKEGDRIGISLNQSKSSPRVAEQFIQMLLEVGALFHIQSSKKAVYLENGEEVCEGISYKMEYTLQMQAFKQLLLPYLQEKGYSGFIALGEKEAEVMSQEQSGFGGMTSMLSHLGIVIPGGISITRVSLGSEEDSENSG